ncbi:hypothetical protein [Novosphingobium sp.]|uniref:hypothetical protein n=1 Tax=Novosphingobium sp. TaxID=1874826 RepID=UPI002733F5A8|nr:hypothetical protein [Novosphingobium sp.]MDP3908315.1 hypothetical protein [Novosphingobium sp.]
MTTATGLRRIAPQLSGQARRLGMNMSVNEAAKLGSSIKDAASSSESVLVEATVQTRDDGSVPIAILSADEAVRVINAHAPRIIYLVEQVFDLADEIEAAQDELDDLGVEHSPSHLKATQRRFAAYDGQIGATIASFMIDGVLHTAVATATWHDEFGDAVEAILEVARENASAGQASKHSEEAKAIDRNALVLLKHPSFNHGRVSFDKRMALAETLFQDCALHTLSDITRRAETLFWLEQSGVKVDGN